MRSNSLDPAEQSCALVIQQRSSMRGRISTKRVPVLRLIRKIAEVVEKYEQKLKEHLAAAEQAALKGMRRRGRS